MASKMTRVGPDSYTGLWEVANVVARSRSIIAVTGAGASTSAGIPDFRSKTGLYSGFSALAGSRRCGRSVKDLFHVTSLSHPEDGPELLRLCARTRQITQDASPTAMHRLLARLNVEHRLVRCYTQNIDNLDEKAGLCADLRKGPGNRPREGLSIDRRASVPASHPRWDHGVECVQLHGSLRWLRCLYCDHRCSWDEDAQAAMLSGRLTPCPSCAEICRARLKVGKRASKIDYLRPDIVLYGEPHPRPDPITEVLQYDLCLDIDLLLVFGTSLAVDGVEELVKRFADVVHEHDGKVIFINLTKPEATWDSVFDYWVQWDCDSWVTDLPGRACIRPFSSFRWITRAGMEL